MIHVLHILRALRTGGLENVVVNLVNGLQRRPDVQCSLGCLIEEGEWMARVAPRGVWVGHLEQRGALRTLSGLSRFIRANRVQLIHSHNSQAHLFGVAASLLTGVPLVHTKHGQNWPDDPRWVWKSRQASRLSRKIVAVSKDIERIVTDIEKVPREKVVTILNGIDVGRPDSGRRTADSDARLPTRLRLGIPAEAFVLGTVGRLAWEKDYELLVRAFSLFLARHPDGFLVIVGDGPYRGRIEAAVQAAGVRDRCLLAGKRDDVRSWLAAMDVFCLSSLTEGTSITLLEACAEGLPAVVTRVGGNAEIVRDGICGLVVPPGDERALATAVLSLREDAALRQRMGAAARARVADEYSLDRMVQAYVAVYRAVLPGLV